MTNYVQEVYDAIAACLQNSAEFTSIVQAANLRLAQGTSLTPPYRQGFLDADFPQAVLDIAGLDDVNLNNNDTTFSLEDPAFDPTTEDWNILWRQEYRLTLTTRDLRTGGSSPLLVAALRAISSGYPKFGKQYVRDIGRIRITEKNQMTPPETQYRHVMTMTIPVNFVMPGQNFLTQ